MPPDYSFNNRYFNKQSETYNKVFGHINALEGKTNVDAGEVSVFQKLVTNANEAGTLHLDDANMANSYIDIGSKDNPNQMSKWVEQLNLKEIDLKKIAGDDNQLSFKELQAFFEKDNKDREIGELSGSSGVNQGTFLKRKLTPSIDNKVFLPALKDVNGDNKIDEKDVLDLNDDGVIDDEDAFDDEKYLGAYMNSAMTLSEKKSTLDKMIDYKLAEDASYAKEIKTDGYKDAHYALIGKADGEDGLAAIYGLDLKSTKTMNVKGENQTKTIDPSLLALHKDYDFKKAGILEADGTTINVAKLEEIRKDKKLTDIKPESLEVLNQINKGKIPVEDVKIEGMSEKGRKALITAGVISENGINIETAKKEWTVKTESDLASNEYESLSSGDVVTMAKSGNESKIDELKAKGFSIEEKDGNVLIKKNGTENDEYLNEKIKNTALNDILDEKGELKQDLKVTLGQNKSAATTGTDGVIKAKDQEYLKEKLGKDFGKMKLAGIVANDKTGNIDPEKLETANLVAKADEILKKQAVKDKKAAFDKKAVSENERKEAVIKQYANVPEADKPWYVKAYEAVKGAGIATGDLVVKGLNAADAGFASLQGTDGISQPVGTTENPLVFDPHENMISPAADVEGEANLYLDVDRPKFTTAGVNKKDPTSVKVSTVGRDLFNKGATTHNRFKKSSSISGNDQLSGRMDMAQIIDEDSDLKKDTKLKGGEKLVLMNGVTNKIKILGEGKNAAAYLVRTYQVDGNPKNQVCGFTKIRLNEDGTAKQTKEGLLISAYEKEYIYQENEIGNNIISR